MPDATTQPNVAQSLAWDRARIEDVMWQHVGVIPGLEKFVAEYTSAKAMGDDGYLAQKGLVPLPKEAMEKVAKSAAALEPLKAEDLK